MEVKPRKAPTRRWRRFALLFAVAAVFLLVLAPVAQAGEAELVLPELNQVDFHGISGSLLLGLGLIICGLGLLFGVVAYFQLRRLPAHRSMKEISELIWQTCKTYLMKQGQFLVILWIFIAIVIAVYFGALSDFSAGRVVIILAFSVIGILGSYGVAWFGIRVNTYANSRTAFESLRGKPYGIHAIPMKSGMSVGMMLISVELIIMLIILIWIPREYAGQCFIGFAIGESLGAAALRIAGGIFTKIADIGSDLMKIVFNIKEDDARNPGVIADCTGDNAGDSVGPSADGFETYGVTGVALITFIILAVADPLIQVALLVWIFAMRIMMIISSGGSYFLNAAIAKARYKNAEKMNYEGPLTSLVWLTSIISIILTFVVSYVLIGGNSLVGEAHPNYWWMLSIIISMGTLAGALIPELVKIFTSTKSAHVKEVVTSSREGGPSLNILSGLVAGNFSGFYIGFAIMVLMGIGYIVSTFGFDINDGGIMIAPAVFAFGLVAFGFLGMGPVTIAVDSYGPVTDNAQSVYELSTIEQIEGVDQEIEKDFGFKPDWDVAKENLEENDGAGNTFKATAKPVLIGTAVVGATTMIFSIIMMLTEELTVNVDKLSLLYPPFLLGIVMGGAVIYWFTGAATQAVTTGAYRAVEFIKRHIRLDVETGSANVEDSKKVVGICTQYAQKGMINIFLAVFFGTLAFAFLEPYFFIGYLISIAVFGLFQAVFMANAGGAWDNAKKIVETDLKEKGTDLHAATVIGDTVGDPFKDTSSVALNPIIKFTTLFGLLAVELAVSIVDGADGSHILTWILAAVFFVISLYFVIRSFYGMRIKKQKEA
ncbi:MAG: sodium-translocating pyrophosphatase [Actinobacteria bacterium]|jgi:K(+)-stimulated pyrophosphate-energized sodium pump|nr:sodium-translocating pyrophosphatase [Actinomycetota bacterium]